MRFTSTHVSPASRSATFMMVFMLAAAGAWLKDDMYHTGYGCYYPVSVPPPLVDLGRSSSTCVEAHAQGKGDYEPIDPAWSEQVRGIPDCVDKIKYRAGPRETRKSLNSASPFSCLLLLHGLDRWLKSVVVLLGYWVCKMSGCGSCKLLWRPLQGPYPLARVMSPTLMLLPVERDGSATATLVLRTMGLVQMPLIMAEYQSDLVLTCLWIMDLLHMVTLLMAYGIMQP